MRSPIRFGLLITTTLVLIGVGMVALIFPLFSGKSSARTQEGYPLVCRGGDSLVIGIAPGERNIGFTFTRGTKPAREGLAPGECSWADRGMYATEPDRLSQHVEDSSESLKAGGKLAPENRWFEELHSADKYWTFYVSNNGQGQLIATSARPNGVSEVTATASVASERAGLARPPQPVENPNSALLQTAQIQSIRLSCTSADIASLQIKTTTGAVFWSHSSCFPYLCDTGARTCATSCAVTGSCAPGMSCVDGKCVYPRTFCKDDHTSANSAGATRDCRQYSCDSWSGLCHTVCESESDCAKGNRCNSDRTCSPY